MFETLYERWQLCDLWNLDVIMYHAPCLDGFASLWALYQTDAMKKRMEKHGQAPPLNVGTVYDATLPSYAGENILMLDFCPKPQPLLDLARTAREIWIIDHHGTAEENLLEIGASAVTEDDGSKIWSLDAADGGPIRAITSRKHSAAGLVWNLYHDKEPPPLIQFVEDRDRWTFKLPGTREFCAGLECEKYDLDRWTDLSRLPFEEVIECGRHVMRYKARQIENYADQATRVRLKMPGQPGALCAADTWLAVHATEHRDEIGNLLAVRPGSHAGGLVWWHEWFNGAPALHVSLRSRTSNVRVTAEAFGGGGHKGAAGFYWTGQVYDLFERL
ncbi:MAG: hypothetical protein KAJ19_14400 [Gammaproteobacteria bacterium]|nr:hypothetical protein [Gammaproteobacteria bacterium]